MEELMAKLQGILGTKEGQEQLKNLQSMFGGMGQQTNSSQPTQPTQTDQSAQPPPSQSEPQQGGGFDFSAIASMLSGLGGTSNSAQNQAPQEDNAAQIDINMIMQLQKVFSSMNTNDKNSQLLLALKPHFSDERSKKVDQAIGMMRLFSMLPMLKESGILKGLTGFAGL